MMENKFTCSWLIWMLVHSCERSKQENWTDIYFILFGFHYLIFRIRGYAQVYLLFQSHPLRNERFGEKWPVQRLWSGFGCCWAKRGRGRLRRVGSSSSSTNTLVTGTGSALLQTAVKRSEQASKSSVGPAHSGVQTSFIREWVWVRTEKEGDKKVGDLWRIRGGGGG